MQRHEEPTDTNWARLREAQLETLERMMRRGTCNVPLILTWVAIGGYGPTKATVIDGGELFGRSR